MQSFKVAKEPAPFLTFQITYHTVYWLILAGSILLAALWALIAQLEALKTLILFT